MTENPFFAAAEASAEQAMALGLPAFLTEIGDSTPVNATPYLLRYNRFLAVADANWPDRTALARRLDAVKTRIETLDFAVEAMLVGGSFTDPAKAMPRDIDCLIFYRCGRDADPSVLAGIQRVAKSRGVDCRLVPLDGDPLVLLKLVSYFTVLYSQGKPAGGAVRSLLLLDCRENR